MMEIPGIVGVCVGLLFILIPAAAALTLMVRTVKRRLAWAHVSGTVSSVKTKRYNDGRTTTTVRYRFVDAKGEQRTGTESTLRTPRKGKKVGVSYNPDDPDDNELSSVVFLVFALPIMALMIGFGVYLLLAGLTDTTSP